MDNLPNFRVDIPANADMVQAQEMVLAMAKQQAETMAIPLTIEYWESIMAAHEMGHLIFSHLVDQEIAKLKEGDIA